MEKEYCMPAPLTGKASQHPAKQNTRGVNDAVGGQQTNPAPKTGKAPRTFERGNPAKSPSRAA